MLKAYFLYYFSIVIQHIALGKVEPSPLQYIEKT